VLGTSSQREALDEYRRRLVAAAVKHGKAVAMITDSVEGARQMIAVGATIINYGSDAAASLDVCVGVEEIRRAQPARSA